MARFLILCVTLLLVLTAPASAAIVPLNFTVTMSEAVNVNTTGGTPRIAITVGTQTRYATYAAGTGTNTLTFTYTPSPGDVDLDGIALTAPIELNSGAITDLAGNPATLTYTAPDTSGINISYPSIDLNFAADSDGAFTVNGTSYASYAAFAAATGTTFARNSIATYYDSAGVLRTATANTARFDHHPVTRAPRGYLVEAGITNLAYPSADFTSGRWGKNFSPLTGDVTLAPDGTTTADKLVADTTVERHFLGQGPSVIAGATYTMSVFAKAAEHSSIQFSGNSAYYSTLIHANFNLATGTVGTRSANVTSGIEDVGNGWYRCWMTATADNSGNSNTFVIALNNNNPSATRIPTYAGDNVSGVYLWGAQFEQSNFMSSYIPTGASSTTTRSSDVMRVPSAGWVVSGQGTLVSQYNSYWQYSTAITVAGSASLDNGNDIDAVVLRLSAVSRNRTGYVRGGSTFLYSQNGPAYTLGATTRDAIGYNAGSTRIAIDGTLGTAGTAAIPATLSLLHVGTDRNAGFGSLFGHVQRLRYFGSRATDADLQRLTQ